MASRTGPRRARRAEDPRDRWQDDNQVIKLTLQMKVRQARPLATLATMWRVTQAELVEEALDAFLARFEIPTTAREKPTVGPSPAPDPAGPVGGAAGAA